MRTLDIALKLLGLADVICAWQAKLASDYGSADDHSRCAAIEPNYGERSES